MNKNLLTLASSCLLVVLSSAHAELLPATQRNCPTGGDLTITPTSSAQLSNCVWLPADDINIQVTLHVAKEVDFITAHCTFSPATASPDKVAEIMTSKSGNSTGSASPLPLSPYSRIIRDNDIQAIIRNFNNTFDDAANTLSHVNVLFYLNKPNYVPGDQITCTFAPLMIDKSSASP
jgi:hypothetical protein